MINRILLRNIGGGWAILCFIWLAVNRFSHPDMTDIRWWIEYWHVGLAGLISMGCGLFVWYKNSE